MELSRRFILVLVAGSLISLPLIKGHGPSFTDGHVAFLPYTAASVSVRVEGDAASRGIFAFPEGTDLASVIKMTVPAKPSHMLRENNLTAPLHRGDLVEISRVSPQQIEIHMKSMKARERMLLGIPLNPDRMDLDDWRCLPGIGPVMAQRIRDYRQKNGEFGSLEGLGRVQGIGDKKIEMLKKYF